MAVDVILYTTSRVSRDLIGKIGFLSKSQRRYDRNVTIPKQSCRNRTAEDKKDPSM